MTDRRDEPWLFDLDFGDDPGDEGNAVDGAPPESHEFSPEEEAPPALSDFDFGDAGGHVIDEEEAKAEGSGSFPFDDPDPLTPDELPLFLDLPSNESQDLAAAPSQADLHSAPALAVDPDPASSAGPVPVENFAARVSEENLATVGPVGPPVEEAPFEEEGGVASIRERALAAAADGLLLVTVLGLCLLGSMAVGGPGSPLRHALPFASFLVVFSFVYSVVSLAFWGQTPGMAIAGVVARAPGDQPLTFGQTGLRWLGGLVTILLAGLPFLLALTGRSLADRLSGSETFQVS